LNDPLRGTMSAISGSRQSVGISLRRQMQQPAQQMAAAKGALKCARIQVGQDNGAALEGLGAEW